jgi:hypothetical protein
VLILGPVAHFRRLVAALLRWALGALWGETSIKISPLFRRNEYEKGRCQGSSRCD